MLQKRNQDYQNRLTLAKQVAQQKDKEFEQWSAQFEQNMQEKEANFEAQRAQLEKEIQETKLSLESESTNKSRAEENWFRELRNIKGKLASANNRIAKLREDVTLNDAEITLLRNAPQTPAAQLDLIPVA